MKNVIRIAGILFVLVMGIMLYAAVSADNGKQDHPYPCHICFYVTNPIVVHVTAKPKACGTTWIGEIDGVKYRMWVVCERKKNGDLIIYVWACPICKTAILIRDSTTNRWRVVSYA
jgi:hypothetical protein